jgi:hypothetical protein
MFYLRRAALGVVRFGSLADIPLPSSDVRFTPESRPSFSTGVMSALCHYRTSRRSRLEITHRRWINTSGHSS